MGKIRPFKERKPLLERFEAKYVPEPNSGCWLWIGSDDGQCGYGRFTLRGQNASAHRAAYEIFVGPIPDGLTIDHLCRTRACVNPAHLEPVPHIENLRRGDYRKGLALGGQASGARQQARTHCANGHEFTAANTYTTKEGWRNCRACHAARQRQRNVKYCSNITQEFA